MVLWVIWVTRDNYSMESFISRDRAYEAYIQNVVRRRRDVFESNVWRLLPVESGAGSTVEKISGELPIPEWLLNNLSAGLCHISGPAFDQPGEVLVATKMTRIGCLAERMVRWLPAVVGDYSGGLRLRHIPEVGLFYAVRGRTLMFSPSRDQLIRALTLAEADALNRSEFEEGIRMAGNEDIYCRLMPDEIPLVSPTFDTLDVVVRFEEDSARMLVQGAFSDEFLRDYGMLLLQPSDRLLPSPFDAPIAVSLDFGQPLSRVIDALAHVSAETGLVAPHILNAYRPAEAGDIIVSLPPLIAAVAAQSGPRLRLGWFGFDHLEMLPAPLLAATFEAEKDGVLMLYEGIVSPLGAQEEIDLVPRIEQDMLVHVPLIGGSNLEPTLVPFSDGFLLSSSYPLAMDLKNSKGLTESFTQSGNIYVFIKPREGAQSLLDVARELAFSGLLKGYTPDTLEKAAGPWMNAAESLSDIAVLGSWGGGALNAQFKISMRPVSDVPVPEPEGGINPADSGV